MTTHLNSLEIRWRMVSVSFSSPEIWFHQTNNRLYSYICLTFFLLIKKLQNLIMVKHHFKSLNEEYFRSRGKSEKPQLCSELGCGLRLPADPPLVWKLLSFSPDVAGWFFLWHTCVEKRAENNTNKTEEKTCCTFTFRGTNKNYFPLHHTSERLCSICTSM